MNASGGEASYTSKFRFADLGLSYYGARWYDPETARFTGVDPVSPHLSNFHSFNRYAYANNNPYKYVDPDGRESLAAELATLNAIEATQAAEAQEQASYHALVFDNSDEGQSKRARYVAHTFMGAMVGLIFRGRGNVAKGGTFPDEIFIKKAPKETAPGTKTLEGQYMNDKGRVEPWKAHYDEHGRQIGRTDYNAGNKAQDISDTHHHTKEYSGQFPDGRSTGDHLPGEYKP